MSLSSWLRDYLFTPLSYATRVAGQAGLVFSLMVTMMAIGVWHGARSSFWAFGLINGIYMAVSALTLRRRNRWFKSRPRVAAAREWFGPLILFHLIVVVFIFFRASTASDAAFILWRGIRGVADPAALAAVPLADKVRFGIIAAGVTAMELGHLAQRRRELVTWFDRRPQWVRWSTYYATGLAIVLLGVFTTQTFIYQQF
jgi:D-alanyl-lipoteichoic acid acyltransferase DltB (MBOAT superfamily)